MAMLASWSGFAYRDVWQPSTIPADLNCLSRGPIMRRFAIVLLMLLPLTACSSTIYKPTLLHPGPAGFQRNNAVQFDPFPPNDMAPEIVGGRPIDYQKPPDENVRARQHSTIAPWRTAPLY